MDSNPTRMKSFDLTGDRQQPLQRVSTVRTAELGTPWDNPEPPSGISPPAPDGHGDLPSKEVRDIVLGTAMEKGAAISDDRLEDLVQELQRR
jgi:hypothetical protein